MSNTAQALLSFLLDSGLTLATAESCTGGLAGQTITSLPGASNAYVGGVISYSNLVKERLLGVPDDILCQHGAVSEETAYHMANGARLATGADIAVSITGIAGPGGGTPLKPVGTVCFGVSTRLRTITYRKQFGEDKSRDEIRCLSVDFAFQTALSAARELASHP